MKIIENYFFVLMILFLFSNCGTKDSDYIDPRGNTYAGSVSCMECHPKIYEEALTSSHYKASAAASIKNVLGDFNSGDNVYAYDQDTKIVMENRNNELFQVLYKKGKEIKAYRFDIVLGAKNAQTSLFWNKDNVFELPLSYYKSVHSWGTSPGYPPNLPLFDGAVAIDCFECHSSHIKKEETTADPDHLFGTEFIPETFKKESLVYGIDCERCHGPALNHVQFHQKNPEIKFPKYITTQQSLNNNQKLAQCIICHLSDEKLKSRFKFKPGKLISEFYNQSHPSSNFNQDVHGNQYGLLSQSECFIKSKSMNCNTCHTTHNDKQESLLSQSQKCLTCHSEINANFCSYKSSDRKSIKENCIDCHMPKKPSKAIGFFLSGKSEIVPYVLRTHKIGIYKEETQKKITTPHQ